VCALAYRQKSGFVKRAAPLAGRCVFFLTCIALLSGCLWRPAGRDSDHELPEMYAYIDAVRQFTIEFPAHWQLQATTPTSVTWAGDAAQAMVMTMPGGLERAERWLQLAHPALLVTVSKEIALAGGSARQLQGHGVDMIYLFQLLEEQGQSAVLEFSMPPADLIRLRPLFLQMAESLRILP
jgi:hypothetical protein